MSKKDPTIAELEAAAQAAADALAAAKAKAAKTAPASAAPSSPQSATSSGTPSSGDAAANPDVLPGVGGPPQVGSTSTAPMYLGVSNAYRFSQPSLHTAFNDMGAGAVPGYAGDGTAPRYKIGDEYAITGMSVENIARLQQSLVAAGLIGAHAVIRRGAADPTTIAAYKSLLGFANQSGTDYNGALATLMSAPAVPVSNTQVTAANPLDSDAALRASAARQLGHDPSEAQLQGFRAAYNAQFEDAQMSAPPTTSTNADQVNPDGTANSTDTGLGVTPISNKRSMQAPTASAAADAYLQQNDQQGIAQQNIAQKYGQFLQMLTGNPASGV